MPINVIQPQQNNRLQDLMGIAQMGVGAVTGNPWMLASGLLSGSAPGAVSTVQSLVDNYNEWLKRKQMMDALGSRDVGLYAR